MGLKLGTLLVREGVITAQQLEEAQRVQALYGGRLGTTLIELNYIDADTLASWLSRVSGFPVASRSMLQDVPDESLQLIPAELAEKFECFPLFKDGRRLHIAMANPADLAVTDAIAFKTGLRLVPYVVPEIVLYSALEKRYGVVRKLRYARLSQSADAIPVVPAGLKRESSTARPAAYDGSPPSDPSALPPLPPHLASLSNLSSVPPPVRNSLTPPPVGSVPPVVAPRVSMLGASAVAPPSVPPTILPPIPAGWSSTPGIPHAPTPTSIPPVSLAHLAPTPVSIPPQRAPVRADPRGAIEALAAARSREEVANSLLEFAPEHHDTMLLFVVRDDLALGWKGRGLGIHERLVDNVMLPLNTPSMFQEAVASRSIARGPLGDSPLHKHFFNALGRNPPQAALVVPVLVRNRAVNLIYVDRLASEDVSALAEPLTEVAKHVADAYERILVDSRRTAH